MSNNLWTVCKLIGLTIKEHRAWALLQTQESNIIKLHLKIGTDAVGSLILGYSLQTVLTKVGTSQ